MLSTARHFPPSISGSSRLSSLSRDGRSRCGCRQGWVSQAFSLCNSLLDIYSFVRFYLYSGSARAHLICTRSSAAQTPSTFDRSFKRHETRNPLPSSPHWERKKLMDAFEWILLIESRVGRRGSTRLVRPFVNAGWLVATAFQELLLSSPLPSSHDVRWKKRRTSRRLPFFFYSLSPFRWLWLEMNFYIELFA